MAASGSTSFDKHSVIPGSTGMREEKRLAAQNKVQKAPEYVSPSAAANASNLTSQSFNSARLPKEKVDYAKEFMKATTTLGMSIPIGIALKIIDYDVSKDPISSVDI